MRILIVTATEPELAPLAARLEESPAPSVQHLGVGQPRLRPYRFSSHDIDMLTTGVGMVATATWCTRAMMAARYDLSLNFGVCGTFDRELAAGAVVHVIADRIAELGAEDGDAFLTVHELRLLCENEFPFQAGEVINSAPPDNVALGRLPVARGITVNTVHGNDRSIASAVERFAPQVESMEGAAFMYACLVHGLPFAQVRSVSNVVERRNRDAWKMPEAIRTLNAAAVEILNNV